MRLAAALIEISLCLPVACGIAGRAARPLAVPDASAVEQIITIGKSPSMMELGPEVVITDRKRIERFAAFLKARNDHWHKPWGTDPSGQWSVVLKARDQSSLFMRVGPNFIGAYEERGGPSGLRFRKISGEDWMVLREILGLSEDKPRDNDELRRGQKCLA